MSRGLHRTTTARSSRHPSDARSLLGTDRWIFDGRTSRPPSERTIAILETVAAASTSPDSKMFFRCFLTAGTPTPNNSASDRLADHELGNRSDRAHPPPCGAKVRCYVAFAIDLKLHDAEPANARCGTTCDRSPRRIRDRDPEDRRHELRRFTRMDRRAPRRSLRSPQRCVSRASSRGRAQSLRSACPPARQVVPPPRVQHEARLQHARWRV